MWVVWYKTNGFEENPLNPVEHQELEAFTNIFSAIRKYIDLKLTFAGILATVCGFKASIHYERRINRGKQKNI